VLSDINRIVKETQMLCGTLGAGPSSRDEAYRIWDELSRKAATLDYYLEEVNSGNVPQSSLQDLVEDMSFHLRESRNVLTETITTGQYQHIVNGCEHPLVDNEMGKLLVGNEFVTVPLIVKNEVIGVILADNAYSEKPITEESIEELSMFSVPAALAIEKANMLQVFEEKVKELEKAYIALEKTHDMLIRHEKLAAIGEVSAHLAHEIRNPLATIGGFAKSIPRKYEDRTRTVRNAKIIVQEVKRLENILSNVLDFTKTGIPNKVLSDINRIVKETLSVMEDQAASHNVIIVMDITEEKLEAKFDVPQIKQVLINVVQNALNAMPNGGVLKIKTGWCDEDVCVTVIDTGIGIPEEYRENIFDPFFTTNGSGTGLGLSISQRIIQNHNGKLEIKSKKGEGTTVNIVFPVS
ncbi:ATP-binding protein, partial [Candidatus Latescibacterota bacterium]